MGPRLILYLGILLIGGFIGYKGLINKKVFDRLDIIQTCCLLFLLFVMGIKMGTDDNVIASFFKLGYQAIIISVFSIFFSVLLVKLVKGYVIKDNEKGGIEQ